MRQSRLGTAFFAGLAAGAIGYSSTGAWAITAGQTDTFEDGTVDNWTGGDTLANVATGGPAGAGDRYLLITSTGGGGPGSNLATYNTMQWSGNYSAAGVTGVAVDLLNPDSVALPMRILLFGPTGGRWESTVADTVPADNLWHHEIFSLLQPDLTSVSGNDTYAATIAGASRLMIRYDPTLSAGGTPIAGSLGIDNVTAVAPPLNLTWNNTGGAAPSDGVTWDIGVNNNWNNGTAATVYKNGSNVTFNDSNGGPASYNVTLNTTVLPGSVVVNNGAGNYTIGGTGSIAGTTALTKSGTGSLTLGTVNTYSGGTNVSAGKLVVGVNGALPDGAVNITGGSLQLGTSTGLATIASLAISGGGTFDVNNNHVIINYGSGTDPNASIGALLATGYNAGSWNGAGGIITSAPLVVGGLSYGIGYADSADAGNPAALSSGTLEIKYTLLGDADLNGIVNGLDFGILAANFNKGVTGWDKGDFDYNNIVNGLDFGDLAANFNKGASGTSVGVPAYDDPALVAFAAANGLLADVPEPTGGAMLLMTVAGVLSRRRSKQPSLR